jgi:hypothetical protein
MSTKAVFLFHGKFGRSGYRISETKKRLREFFPTEQLLRTGANKRCGGSTAAKITEIS